MKGEGRAAQHLSVVPPAMSADDRKAMLELRLGDGFQRIELAAAAGEDISAWESFWLQLLDDYESLWTGAKAA